MLFRRPHHTGFAALAIALAALAGCAPAAVVPPRPLPLPAAPPPSGEACLEELNTRGVSFELVSERAAVGGCNVLNAVRLRKLLAPFDRPADMTCQMALLLDDFEINVVQVAAQRYFNRRVALVHQLGAYSCRNINGTHKLSEHARGQAIDIGGFVLDGGIEISVKDHWKGAGARSLFLHDVARGACRIFNVVLTPNTNADHLGHLHLDLGPYPLCGA